VSSSRASGGQDQELIKLITLLIKYSGPPKMYAVGTVSFHIRSCFPSDEQEAAAQDDMKDESN
jgi:hypothetical protein